MLKEKESLIKSIYIFIDVLLTVLSLFVAFYLRENYSVLHFFERENYISLLFLVVPLWFLLLKLSDLNKFHRTKSYSAILIECIVVVGIGLLFTFLFIFLFKIDDISRVFVFLFGIVNLFFIFVSKVMVYAVFKHFRRRGYNTRNLLLIVDENAVHFLNRIFNSKEWGYNVYAIFTDSQKIKKRFEGKTTILPKNTDLSEYLVKHTIDEVIQSLEVFHQEEVQKMIYMCFEVGVTYRLHTHLFGMVANRGHVTNFGEFSLLTFNNTPIDSFALRAKSVFDVLMSLVILLLASPMLITVAILVKTTSKGPILFHQTRVGLHGRLFKAYKFRTMIVGADDMKNELKHLNESDGPVFKMKNDPRITKIGAFLRKYSIDEFPQFFNVLKGEMSIVGPRPPVPSEVEKYERWQLRRLSMKPGITCIWQVSGRNKIGFRQWMNLDLQYIDNWSFKLDLILFLRTIQTVFKADGM